MNKILIPSILAVTVLVAGIFAFMPVEQARTVHTTILATAVDVITSQETETLVDDVNANTHTVTLTFDNDAIVTSLRLSVDITEAQDNFDVSSVIANGDTLAELNAFANPAANNAVNVDWVNTAAVPLVISSGNTIVIAFEEEDVNNGADNTITIDITMLANAGIGVTSGVVVT